MLVAKGFSQPEHVLLYDSLSEEKHKEHILSCMSSLLHTQEKEMTEMNVRECPTSG